MNTKTVNEVHDQAMDLAETAATRRRRGFHSRDLYIEAALMELWCALVTEVEPSRGVLYLSAAWLFHDAKAYTAAVKAADLGLAGKPYPEIRTELLEVKEAAQHGENVLHY